MRKKTSWEKGIGIIVFGLLVMSSIFVLVMLFAAPSDSSVGERSKSDYILMLLQCVFGIFAMLLPGIAEHKIKIIIPSKMIIVYSLFLYAAIYLGEVRNFYYTIPHWDTILHIFSGGMLGALGFSIITLLNKTDSVPVNLSPSFVALFSFCFAAMLGVLWEIYEFTCDGLLGLNMQKSVLANGTALYGHAALSDTMKDLIVDILGALVISVCGYVSLKYKKGWVEKILLKKRDK